MNHNSLIGNLDVFVILEIILGITWIKNTELKAGIIIQIGSKCSGLLTGTIEINTKQTAGAINIGSKFLLILLKFSIVKPIIGKIIKAKKWILMSPKRRTENKVPKKIPARTIKFFLSG